MKADLYSVKYTGAPKGSTVIGVYPVNRGLRIVVNQVQPMCDGGAIKGTFELESVGTGEYASFMPASQDDGIPIGATFILNQVNQLAPKARFPFNMNMLRVETVYYTGVAAGSTLLGIGPINEGIKIKIFSSQPVGKSGPISGNFVLIDAGKGLCAGDLRNSVGQTISTAAVASLPQTSFAICRGVNTRVVHTGMLFDSGFLMKE